MIYGITFNDLRPQTIYEWQVHPGHTSFPFTREMINKQWDPTDTVVEAIKTLEDSSFVFILQKKQVDAFNAFLDKYDLRKYIVYQMPTWVTNQVHDYNGRNLKAVVLATNPHFWREMYPETPEDFYLEEITV